MKPAYLPVGEVPHRRDPDADLSRCVFCGTFSKRARTHKDRLCLVCASEVQEP